MKKPPSPFNWKTGEPSVFAGDRNFNGHARAISRTATTQKRYSPDIEPAGGGIARQRWSKARI